MPFIRPAAFSLAIALVTSPALAVTPDEVWSDWQNFLTGSYGATLDIGDESRVGETIRVSDLTITADAEEGFVEVIIDSLSFENIGNGAVQIEMSESIPLTTEFPIEDGESARVSMVFGQPGANLIAEGGADDIRYTFDYPTMTLGQLTITGDDVPDEQPVNLSMSLSALNGFILMSGTDVRTYETESTLGSLGVTMTFAESDGSGQFALNMSDLSQTASGTVGSFEPGASLSELVLSGTTQSGRATYGPTTYTLAADGPEGQFEMASAAESGAFAVEFDKDGLVYSGTNRSVTASFAGSGMPIPAVSFQMAEAGGEFRFPVIPADEPQDFGLILNLDGVEIDQALWSMLDPAGAIPRDPASLVLDLSGTGILTADFSDPEFAEEIEDTPPGELLSLNINQLLLSLAGAELTGDGQFTFSNEGEVPMPAGMATIALTGGNALLDTLVGMGVLPEEQAMGARMMMGLFARPVGDDQLVSEIEVTEDGQILANGQRIR